MSRSTVSSGRENNGYVGWHECNCCPYGYHIDLDFVRYCETIERQSECTGSIKRRKDRRRQRQSMEVLLGLTPPPPLLSEIDQVQYKTIQEQESPKVVGKADILIKNRPFVDDVLDDVVNDFERTLQRSKKKMPNNLPDVTAVTENIRRAPSVCSMSSSASASSIPVLPAEMDGGTGPGKDFDTISVESCGLSPAALHTIREQMAISLERTKELEEQVKLIPSLHTQIEDLKDQNRKLLLKLHSEENSRLNKLNGNYLNITTTTRNRSQSVTDAMEIKEPPPPPPRRDCGVMCGVLTRNVGVGHQNPNTKTVSTATIPENNVIGYSDKWLGDKLKFLNIPNNNFNQKIAEVPKKPLLSSKGIQTIMVREKRDSTSQTVTAPRIIKNNVYIQTEIDKELVDASVMTTPKVEHVYTQLSAEMRSIGVSNDTIFDVLCTKCSSPKISVAVGPETTADSHVSPICLANLTMPRSKSFNLGEDKLNLSTRSKTVACQHNYIGQNKGCQYEFKSISKSCQHEAEVSHKALQCERRPNQSKVTDTTDLTPAIVKKNVACEAKESKKECVDAACNTNGAASGPCPNCALNKEKESKKDENAAPSRIPRPQVPTTPVENRKFRRQDTYTKIPAPASAITSPDRLGSSLSDSKRSPQPSPATSTPIRLSGLDLSYKSISNESSSAIEKVKQTLKTPPLTSAQNGVNSGKEVQEMGLPLAESSLYQSPAQCQHKKSVPSKEMQGAMKVLNDHLQKSPNKNLKNQLKNAIGIIQQEWFQVSSLIDANPLDVEDYLDCFEEMSYALLEYIVNMGDASGNTAMHYAVSHGNFDVVSILLDSKVCDINKQNNAGYTSVMLVSLAEVKSVTHANVVKKLFQLADVNIRAKQHGQTALMLAVSHGRLDMVTMLLEAGADINIQDEDGSTALMCAAEHGHVEIVKHFLSQPDCDSSITDVDGSTALNIAMEAGHRHIGVLLYAHDRNLGAKHKKSKSTSASPKTPSSPHLPIKNLNRALPDLKNNK